MRAAAAAEKDSENILHVHSPSRRQGQQGLW
jgi:hypothetical protein